MRTSPPLLKTTIFLTFSNLFLRLIGLYFQSRLTARLGAEGMGLFSLALSAEALAVTLATSGIHYSATRLLSEAIGRGEATQGVLRCCLGYALAFSVSASVLLFLCASPLADFSGDLRITDALRCFTVCLPPLALNAVFSGYFTAVWKPWKAAVSQFSEQLLMTCLSLLLLRFVPDGQPERCCVSITLAAAAADWCSLLVSYLLYICPKSIRKSSIRASAPPVLPRLLQLSLPIALSSYGRTALSSLRHLLVPKALRRSGFSASEGLAVYGTISGMVFPVLTFASVFFSALSEMLIPKLTAAQLRGDQAGMEYSAGRILRASLLFSVVTALLLYLSAPLLAQKLYRSAEAGVYIRVLSPLVPVMYLDSVVDGMLKGLGLQFDSMKINLADAALTLLAVAFLLPRFGITAYIGILYFSDCFNFLLSFLRLRKNLSISLL